MERMLGRRALRLTAMLVGLASLSACAQTRLPVRSPELPERTSWAMPLSVVETDALYVVSRSASTQDDALQIRLAEAPQDTCSVSVSIPGSGGPDNVVGEKISIEIDGRPGFRGGAGAESAYVLWQLRDERWVSVDCNENAHVDAVVAAVRLRPSAIRVPFDLTTVPNRYRVSLILQDLDDRSAQVYLDRDDDWGATVTIAYLGRRVAEIGGDRTVDINGRPATVDDDPRGPSVCLEVQRQPVCVRSYVSDTGPYPNRSGELPTLLALAEDLAFAEDLVDPTTWFAAEQVFG